MRCGFAFLAFVFLWIGTPAASAAGTVDCASAATPAHTTLCAHPPLVLLDRELADLIDAHAAANQGRPQRIQRFARQLERHQRDLERCGIDVACMGEHYVGWIDWMDSQAGRPPRDWTATRAELAMLVDAARKSAGALLTTSGEAPHALIGFWRGAFDCRLAGRKGPLEFVFDAGFAGTVVGFMSAWTTESGPLDAIKRGGFDVAGTEDPRSWQMVLIGSRIDKSVPGMTFSSGTFSLDETGQTITGSFDGASCEPFTLTRSERSEGLDAVLAWVDTFPNGRDIWDWPYAAQDFPAPELLAFCTEAVGWMRLLHDDYPEALVMRMGADIIQQKAINLLDDPRFIAFAGKPFDEMADAERKTIDERIYRGCLQNPIIRRAMRWSQGATHALGAREGTYPFEGVMQQLSAVRAARAWRDNALASVGDPSPASYATAVALGPEGETQLAALMPGDLRRFDEALLAARRASGPSFAKARLATVSAERQEVATLASLAQAIDELAPVFADMEPAARDAIIAATRGIEDGILTTLMAREAQAIEGFGSGLAAIEAGRRWYGRFMLDYGRYQDRPQVAAAMAAFSERRGNDVGTHAADLAAMIAATEEKPAFDALMESHVIAGVDDDNPQIAAALGDRAAHFQRQELLAGFSPYERSLADADGVLVVPATYPEPTEDEIALAVAREYSQYGTSARDGSFTYGLIPETSVEMRIISVRKQGCSPAADGGYRCTRVLTMQMGMSRAMQGILGNSIQGDIMQAFLDDANATQSDVIEDHFVLTPQGWRSTRAAESAARGMANSLNTVTDVIGGVACGLAELGDMGGC